MEFKDYLKCSQELISCARSVLDETVKKMTAKEMDGLQLSVSIPCKINNILGLVVNEHYSEEERYSVWELIYAVLHDVYKREDYDVKINSKLETIFSYSSISSIDFFLDSGLEWGDEVMLQTEDEETGEFTSKKVETIRPDDTSQEITVAITISFNNDDE